MTNLQSFNNPTISVINGKAATTSLDVAKHFNKDHKNVLRAIKTLECSKEFIKLNFELNEYKDSIGRKLTMYMITKDGFVFLAMGFTGKEAAKIKEAYINAFNKMEEELLKKATPLLTTLSPEHQIELHEIVQRRAKEIPATCRSRAYPAIWRALKHHFKKASYKDIPDSQFEEATQFLNTYVFDGDWLPKEIKNHRYHFPKDTVKPVKMLHKNQAWLTYDNLLNPDSGHPILDCIKKLKENGNNVEGMELEYKALILLVSQAQEILEAKDILLEVTEKLKNSKNTALSVWFGD